MAVVKTEAGLYVDEDVAQAAAQKLAEGNGKHGPASTYDPDGRRRILLPVELRKKVDALIREMKAAGLGIVVACRVDVPKPDGKPGCGQFMLNEGLDTDDPGYGCQCGRIHWIR